MTGADKQRCNDVGNNHKSLPFAIFRRKLLPKDKFPPGIIVRVQERGWLTEKLPQMVKRGVLKAAGHTVTQVCHISFRHLWI
jgi:hypothetical protein